MKQTRSSQPERRRLPHAALLVLALVLAGAVVYLTWPGQKLVTCESLPELTALAACAAALFVFAARALAASARERQDRRLSGGALVLAALALFLSVHFIAVYRVPCTAVQHQFRHR